MKHWIRAFRLRTLPLAMASIGMGTFLAASEGSFDWRIFLLCTLTTVFLQILSNLSNDYGDFVHGADHEGRTGPDRAVSSGAISPSAMRLAMGLFGGLSLISGILLVHISLGWGSETFWWFMGLGLLSIIAAITYTSGNNPYGYAGLGDLSVILFFGLTGVMGSYFLYTHGMSWSMLLPALSVGFFSAAVLNVNNIRDIESDKVAGKMSIPVRIGRKNAVIYHLFLLAAGFFSAVLFTFLNFKGSGQYLFLLSLPLLLLNAVGVMKHAGSGEIDRYLKQMALTTLVFVLSFGVGMLMAG